MKKSKNLNEVEPKSVFENYSNLVNRTFWLPNGKSLKMPYFFHKQMYSGIEQWDSVIPESSLHQ